MSWHSVQGDDLLLHLRIQPRATPEGVAGLHGGRLKLRVSSPPVDGAANARVIAVLAEVLGCPKGKLGITRGERGRDKDVRIAGGAAQRAQIVARLGPPES